MSELSEEAGSSRTRAYKRPSASAPDIRWPSEAIPYLIDLASCPMPVEWGTIFGNEHPVELEVGSERTVPHQRRDARPGVQLLRIELRTQGRRARPPARIAKRRLSNVKILPGDALNFLRAMCRRGASGSSTSISPTRGGRSGTGSAGSSAEGLVASVERALVPRGELSVVTDVEEYFGVICELMASRTLFEEVL